MKRNSILSLLFILLIHLSLDAQYRNQSKLTLENIMQGERFVGFLPENIQWNPDSRQIHFSWKPNDTDTLRNQYKVIIEDPTPVQISEEELIEMPARGQWNKDRTMMVYTKNGDIYLFSDIDQTTRQITKTTVSENNPQFSQKGDKIYFRVENNLYSINLEGGSLVQWTDIRSGKEKPPVKPAGAEKWLNDDQLELFEVLQYRERVNELQKERREKLRPKSPKTFYLGDDQLNDIRISPNEDYIVFRVSKTTRGKTPIVPDYVTTSGYTTELRTREKVGTGSVSYKSYIHSLSLDTLYEIQTSGLSGIYDKPDFLKEYHKDTTEFIESYDKERSVVIHGPFFSDDGIGLVDIKSLDNKDRWLATLDLTTGQLKQMDRQRDEAWIGGPGIYSWTAAPGNLGWFPSTKVFWFQSEESGFSHLYTMNAENGHKRTLTSGNFEVLSAELSHDGDVFYITANKEGPHEQHFYHLSIDDGNWTQITSKIGGHQVSVSPDETYLAIRYSYNNKPWELYIMPNRPGEQMKQITSSTLPAFDQYKWREPEIVWFTASDGVKVPARLYKPVKPKKNGPAVIFVHGAGYLQNVHQWWSSYYREYMFHNFLTDNGYTVLDIDFRASSGYGRDWRTAIYRDMGGKDLSDQVDGAAYLVKNHNVGKNKIGIYGGSYGGFITLMAMFKNPDVFRSGAALRSVADWSHYNQGYTANILNTPTDDPRSYYRSSPIYHADGLKGDLLMLHGMIDINVHFQDVVRLSQKLIELGKDNWEMAIFPLEDHGFIESSSWLDEYKRIYRLFEETLR